MKIWKLTIENAKGKSKGQTFSTIKAPNGEKTHVSETVKLKANTKKTLLALIKAIQEGRIKIVDNTLAPKKEKQSKADPSLINKSYKGTAGVIERKKKNNA